MECTRSNELSEMQVDCGRGWRGVGGGRDVGKEVVVRFVLLEERGLVLDKDWPAQSKKWTLDLNLRPTRPGLTTMMYSTGLRAGEILSMSVSWARNGSGQLARWKKSSLCCVLCIAEQAQESKLPGMESVTCAPTKVR